MPNMENNNLGGYAQTTEQITVTVDPIFLDDESDPDAGMFFWLVSGCVLGV